MDKRLAMHLTLCVVGFISIPAGWYMINRKYVPKEQRQHPLIKYLDKYFDE